MQKSYSKNSRMDSVTNNMAPKEKTVRFILDYSAALSVIDYNTMKFEALLN